MSLFSFVLTSGTPGRSFHNRPTLKQKLWISDRNLLATRIMSCQKVARIYSKTTVSCWPFMDLSIPSLAALEGQSYYAGLNCVSTP